MERPFYFTSQFAKKGSVSIRTLRYYDKESLLSPSYYNEAGYRLYTDEDLVRLQYILALKFLGFSLDEIKVCLQSGTNHLQAMLSQQKKMMLEKRTQIDQIIRAMEETERLLQNNDESHSDSIIKIIEVIQMELKSDWVNKYLTPEQRKTMRHVTKSSFSEEALQKLKEQWSKENEISFFEQYSKFRAELKSLVAKGADPASDEAQKLARFLMELNKLRSQGDSEILAGMKKSWENFNTLPEDQQPAIYKLSGEEREFIKKACSIFR